VKNVRHNYDISVMQHLAKEAGLDRVSDIPVFSILVCEKLSVDEFVPDDIGQTRT
jgi:hypothetical protein